jgi:8-oxo-dGTP pyrophosphatase MutT (NUDIX family)
MPDLDPGQDRRRTDPVPGKKVTFRPLGNETMPPEDRVTSVATIPFTEDGLIVCVELRDRGVDIPGGHVRERESTLTDAVRREAREEASIELTEPKLVEVIESDYYGSRDEDLTYMLTYASFVNKFMPFAENEESERRLFLTRDEFLERYRGDNDLMRAAVEGAMDVLGIEER